MRNGVVSIFPPLLSNAHQPDLSLSETFGIGNLIKKDLLVLNKNERVIKTTSVRSSTGHNNKYIAMAARRITH